MTSNLGSQLIQDHFEKVNEKNLDDVIDQTKEDVFGLLRKSLRPEFLNRIDEVILFHPLLRRDIRGIIKIQLEELTRRMAENDFSISFTDYAIEYLTEFGYDAQFGARPLKRLIQKEIINPLSKKILGGEVRKELPVVVDVFDRVVVFRNETRLLQSVK